MSESDGRFLGKYRLLSRLGQGGMGTVYKAYQPGLERLVAIKMLRHDQDQGEAAVSLFKKEARAIARLRHPNILQIYDFDVDDDVMYMVTEFVDGVTLDEYLQADNAYGRTRSPANDRDTPLLIEPLPQVKVDIPQLHHILDNRFSEGELKTLCLYLGIDYEDLPGQAQVDKARELILYLERRNSFARLLTEGQKYRPDIEWEQVISLAYPLEDSSNQGEEKGGDDAGQFDDVVRIFTMLAEAVQYAHSQNVVHHDLKPENVLVTPQGEIILTDFGLAHILDATLKSREDMVMGTPLYISPEQCQGQRGDKRSDIYALGVILFEMLTGQVPFNAHNYAAIIMKHIMEPPPLPRVFRPGIPSPVEAVVLRALRKDADGRFQSAREMAEALQKAVQVNAPIPKKNAPFPGKSDQETPSAVSAPFQIPRAIHQFVGRGDLLAEIETAVRHPSGNNIICLHGMPGVGKTATAVQIAYQLRPHFPDGVLWANVAGSDPMDILDNWAKAFGHNYATLPDLANRAAAMRNALGDKQVLIVLDDVDSKKQVDSLLPNNPGILVILTTRFAELGPAVGAQSFQINLMSAEDGSQLFAAIVGKERVSAEPDAAAEICQLVGFLPLAVKISGQRLVSRPRWSLASFVRRLENEKNRLSELNILDEGVQASFDVSWDLLNDELREAFAQLAVFGARPFSLAAFATITQADEFTAGDHLDSMVALSLLHEDGRETYRQHPLLADFARNKLNSSNASYTRHSRYYMEYVQAHKGDPIVLQQEWDNIRAGLHHVYENQQWQEVMEYVDALENYLFTQGRFTTARAFYAMAHQAAKGMERAVASANYLGKWGQACIEQGNYNEAKHHLEKSLSIHKKNNNKDGIVNNLYYLGYIAFERSQFEAAEGLFSKCRHLYQELSDPLGDALSLYQLAYIRFYHREFEVAADLLQQALTIQQTEKDELGEIRSLRLFTDIALFGRNDVESAENYNQSALDLAEKIQDIGEIAVSVYGMAEVYRRQGKLQLAQQFTDRSQKLLEAMGDRKSLAQTIYRSSQIHADAEEWDSALARGNHSLHLSREVGDDFGVVFVLSHLGDVHLKMEQAHQAKADWQQAKSIAEEIDHPLLNSIQSRLDALL